MTARANITTTEAVGRHVAYRQWNSAADFARGTFAGTTERNGALTIDSPTGEVNYRDPYGDGSSRTYDRATWTSPKVTPGFDYTELVASWNAQTPTGTWVEVSVAAGSDTERRSNDYVLGRWASDTSTIHRTSVAAQGDDLASVCVDTLVARAGRELQSWQLTVSLFRAAGSTATPSVSLVGAMASRRPDPTAREPASPPGDAEGTALDVPTYSQEIHVGEYPQFNGGGEAWCSPTSTAMVLAYWQRVMSNADFGPTAAHCSAVDPSYPDPQVDFAAASTYDWSYDGTGNWPFNTAYAGRFGLESFVTRLRSLTEAEQFIRAGIPLVVSVSFVERELTGAGYGTSGHLLVIVGFTESGDVVVNDPASHLIASNDQVRSTYDRGEFESVWVPRSGGIAYVIHPASYPLPATLTPHEPNW